MQRSDQTDKQLGDHEARLDAYERTRWPPANVTALAAVVGAVSPRGSSRG